MAVHAIVPAAGSGTRMGAGRAKQFLELAGQPLLCHTVRALLAWGGLETLTLVVPAGELAWVEEELLPRGEQVSAQAVRGGADRQESVWQGLLALGEMAAGEIVVVHDGVRPFVTAQMLGAVVEAAGRHGAASCGVAAKDTVKLVGEGGLIERTLERGRCYLTQTPQAFRYALLKEAHEAALAQSPRAGASDDAALVERLGRPVAMTAGRYENIKITTPEDLALAETIARWTAAGAGGGKSA